ncbi:DUF499 domain-containing protein [Anaerolineales bacterium HSG24]|nr:DUF499 domain-containing protein [Anaerolineales bacterium HSG24]
MTTTALAWTPWHQVVQVRDDVKTGELSLKMFAADLYDVVIQDPNQLYHKPYDFFALTYPTHTLLELARDVVLRLAGQNDKAVRQLELTYGGGKTHTLITLYHLVNQPDTLPTGLSAMQEFLHHIGQPPPQARIAVLPFDKLDVEKGMFTHGPNGETRWLRQPWSVLAFQLAGRQGLTILHKDGLDEERDTPPAENLLSELLAIPAESDLATLILMDEVLMYARGKIGMNPIWLDRLTDFFQYLTQAASKTNRCAIVASLLATDPKKNDDLGKRIAHDLFDIFRRIREEGVQPVQKEDVAEVLRRRFFKPESLKDTSTYRAHVTAALQGINNLDKQIKKEGDAAKHRFEQSYPFHPDLIDVFYTKWTSLQNFQRTRGILRTFALALREAEQWDNAPLIATNIFLTAPTKAGISEATRELTGVAESEEFRGRKQPWSSILESELSKAIQIQNEFPNLQHREMEQAAMTTFLHSQPINQKALTRELLLLVGHTRPDKIELTQALKRWTEISWFLDEAAITEASDKKTLPTTWRLGSRPNLQQMHYDACQNRVNSDDVEKMLTERVKKLKSKLADSSTVRALGGTPHSLIQRPSDIADNGEFHFAVLCPSAASEAKRPSEIATRFINNTTPNKPRANRNAVVLLVPSKTSLVGVKQTIKEYIGWQAVEIQLKQEEGAEEDAIRTARIEGVKRSTEALIEPKILQAYCIVVTVNKTGQVDAFQLTYNPHQTSFNMVKADKLSRIQDTPVDAESLLPDGAYNLWRAGETSRRVDYLVGAFAQNPQLPKMTNRRAIMDTLVDGCEAGSYVLRTVRPNQTYRTYWRTRPDETALKDPSLELAVLEQAQLKHLSPSLLLPDKLPQLWSGDVLTLETIYHYFSGQHELEIIHEEGWPKYILIPQASTEVTNQALQQLIQQGQLWLISGAASLLKEDVPPEVLTPQATLQRPPTPIQAHALLPEALPSAWSNNQTTAKALSDVLSQQHGQPLPWHTIQHAINVAFQTRTLDRTINSVGWPCDYSNANNLILALPQVGKPLPGGSSVAEGGYTPPPPRPKPNTVTTPTIIIEEYQMKELEDQITEIATLAKGYNLAFTIRLELSGKTRPPDEVIAAINKLLAEVDEGFTLR